MRAKNWKVSRNAHQGGFLLAAGVLTAQRMLGGSVIMSQPPVVTTPPVVQEEAADNEMNVFIPSGVVNPDSAGIFQYGDATLHPHVNYTVLYGSGIQSSIGSQQDTVLQQFSPGLTVDLGRHWTVDYTPTFNFYSSRQLQDNIDQAASLTGATRYEDWSFGLSQTFNSSQDPSTETGAQTSQQAYATSLSAGYSFNDKWSANAAVNQNFNLVSGLQDSYNWSTSEGVSYQFFPRLNGGISIGGGYTKVTDNSNLAGTGAVNPNVANEQAQLNLNWRATGKVSFQVSGGVEDQQFLAAGYQDSLEPIFSAAVQYQPFKVTEISLTGSRSVSASDYYIIAQSSEATTVSLNLNQRILVKYNLNLGLSYSKTDYTTTLLSLNSARTDDQYSFNASFGRSFLTRGSWAITYQYSDNKSDIAGYSQRSNQIGFQIGFHY
jgi:hypothetical protein